MTEAKMPVRQANKTVSAVSTGKNVQFSAYIKSNAVTHAIESTLGDVAKAKTFAASLISAVGANPQLRDCDFSTIVSSALLGESLKLSPSPQLGQYYMVPFNDRTRGKVATFILGWKGYYQLAMRSGAYKRLHAIAVKEGEVVKYDPINEDYEFETINDPSAREKAKTVGYYAFFETVNGFKKSMYWTKEQMEHHALTYSKGYAAKKGYTFWEKDFDSMALKTMFRQLISKYGVMSIDMVNAFEHDNSYSDLPKDDGETSAPIYFDTVVADAETGEVIE